MNSSKPPFSPPPRHPDSINPVLISIIGALGSIFLVVGYYQLLLRYCACFEHDMHGRLGTNQDGSGSDDEVSGTGLDSSLVARIPIVKYRAGNTDSGNECSVCLTEFSEGGLVRMLPKCSHAFHISCIGLWLNTHSNCPLCRANIALSLAERLSPKKVEERVSPTAPGQEIEPRRSPASVYVVERPLHRSFSYGDSSHLPPEGASSSQWYQRFRWSARTSSPSREDQMRSRLLDIEGKEDLEVGINFDPTVGVSNGGNHSSPATKMECL